MPREEYQKKREKNAIEQKKQALARSTKSFESLIPKEGKASIAVNNLISLRRIAGLVDKNDIDSLNTAFLSYLQYCAEADLKVGNLGAYMALNILPEEATAWALGKKTAEHQDFILMVRAVCSANREMLAQEGEISPAIAIFWAKNFDGMAEEVKHTATVEYTEGRKTPQEIMEKYKDLQSD